MKVSHVKQLLEMGELEFFGRICMLAAEYSQHYGWMFASFPSFLAFGKIDFSPELSYSSRPLLGGIRILQFLYGNGAEGTLLGRTGRMLTGTTEPICLYEWEFQQMQAAWRRMEANNREPGVLLLQGKLGSGKKFLMRRLAGIQSNQVFCIGLESVMELSMEEREEWFRQLCLERRLSLAVFAFDGVGALFLPKAEGMLRPQARWLLNRLAELNEPFAVLGEQELAPGLFQGIQTISISLKMPGPRQKIRMWELFCKPYQMEEDVSLELLGS